MSNQAIRNLIEGISSDNRYYNIPEDCIYLDYHASTPIDHRVLHKMIQSLAANYGNPHSTSHTIGRAAEEEIQSSREKIANSFNLFPEDIIFTSGATEANNLALLGLCSNTLNKISKIITIETEHKSVLEPINFLKHKGIETEIHPVLQDGSINLDLLQESLKNSNNALISISAANGEIGTIHPLEQISNLCSQFGAYWHCDGTQAVGRVPLDISKLSIDLFTFSGHKIYGPKGIGALVIKPELKSILQPIILGGGQQAGLRAGTIPTFLCSALGEASILAINEIEREITRIKELRDTLLKFMQDDLGGILNGTETQRLSNNINISFPGISALDIIANSPKLCISTGSACSSSAGQITTSHVIRAITKDLKIINGAIRLSLGRFTTQTEVDLAMAHLKKTINHLRKF